MSDIKINKVTGGNNIIGDNNTIINGKKVWKKRFDFNDFYVKIGNDSLVFGYKNDDEHFEEIPIINPLNNSYVDDPRFGILSIEVSINLGAPYDIKFISFPSMVFFLMIGKAMNIPLKPFQSK